MWANAGARWKANNHAISLGKSGGYQFDRQFTKQLAGWNERYSQTPTAVPAVSYPIALAYKVPPSTVPSVGKGSHNTALDMSYPDTVLDMSYLLTEGSLHALSCYTGDEHSFLFTVSNSGRLLPPASVQWSCL